MRRCLLVVLSVLVLASVGVASPAQAGYRQVPGSLARAMAVGSGFGAGPAKCYQGGVSTRNRDFGMVSKTLWGKSHSSECRLIDASLAIVHYNGTQARWEMVDYFLSPDCVGARSSLRSFGAGKKVIEDLIGDWPC